MTILPGLFWFLFHSIKVFMFLLETAFFSKLSVVFKGKLAIFGMLAVLPISIIVCTLEVNSVDELLELSCPLSLLGLSGWLPSDPSLLLLEECLTALLALAPTIVMEGNVNTLHCNKKGVICHLHVCRLAIADCIIHNNKKYLIYIVNKM